MCVPTPGSPNGPTAGEALANTLNAMQPGSVPGPLVGGKAPAPAPAAATATVAPNTAPGVNPSTVRAVPEPDAGSARRAAPSATPFRSDLSIPTGGSSGASGNGINIPR